MNDAPPPLKPGDELTTSWLNKLLALARRAQINLGVNSGLAMGGNGNNQYLRAAYSDAVLNYAYYANPSGAIAGATGTWTGGGAPSSYVPGDVTGQTIYQAQATSYGVELVGLNGTYTIYNWFPAATTAGKVMLVQMDGCGNWVFVQQSCT